MAAGLDPYAQLEQVFLEMRFPPTPPDEQAQEMRLETPPMLGLPSPDYTPPGGPIAAGAKMDTRRGESLETPKPPFLTFDNTSRTESFMTAREEPSIEVLAGVDLRGLGLGLEPPMSGTSWVSSSPVMNESDGRSTPKPVTAQRDLPRTPSPMDTGIAVPASSRVDKRPNTPPSGGSARRKRYRDNASESGTAGSHDAIRSKSYQEASSSGGSPQVDHSEDWEKHVSYVHSDDEGLRDEPSSPEIERPGFAAVESPDDHAWHKRVSYLSFNDDEVVDPVTIEANVAKTSGSRLRGKGAKRSGHGMNTGKARSIGKIDGPSNSGRSDQFASQAKHALHRVPHLDALKPPPLNITVRKKRPPVQATIEVQHSTIESQKSGLYALDSTNPILTSYQHNTDELDLIFKHIRTANMDRYDALSSGITVEAKVISAQDAIGHALRRVSKCHSLRTASETSSVAGVDLNAGEIRDRTAPHSPSPEMPSLVQSNRLRRQVDFADVRHGIKDQKVRAVSSPVISRTLRREKRVLSDAIKQRPVESDSNDSQKAQPSESGTNGSGHRLRYPSMPIDSNLATTLGKAREKHESSVPHKVPVASENEAFEHGLRRHSKEYRLEHLQALERLSVGHASPIDIAHFKSPTTPRFLGMSAHQHSHSVATIASQSQWSANAELCEASNVEIFPHSNESVMILEDGSRPTSQDKEDSMRKRDMEDEEIVFKGPYHGIVDKLFTKRPAPPTFALNGQDMQSSDAAYSELPMINCIPPTPNSELDKQLIPPEKRPSLATHARRFSEILFPRRVSISQEPNNARNISLHPNWRPSYATSFSSDSYDSLPDMGQDFDVLPRGGDTSDHPASFPRKLSVRMPGFRGTGGFSQGNSLGIDRHGTNVRRHWIDSGRLNGTKKKGFGIPGTGRRVVFVGFGGLTGKTGGN